MEPHPRLELKEALEKSGRTQLSWANELGVSHINVSYWVTGRTSPNILSRARIRERTPEFLKFFPKGKRKGK